MRIGLALLLWASLSVSASEYDGTKARAEQGNVGAQYILAVMYKNGHGTPHDYKEALRWYKAAAEQGLAVAQYDLGNSYNNGQGTPQDYKEAIKWYKAAAEQGHTDAQITLGLMYRKGKGTPHDYKLAHMWFNLAAANGHENAVKNRDMVAEQMTSEDIALAQQMAKKWLGAHPSAQ